MKLLLTSQSIHNASIATALRELLEKPSKECTAVYITTSQNGAVGDKSWFIKNLNDAYEVHWKSFETIDVAAMIDLPRDMWWSHIEAADVIFVGGGANYYLGYWLEKSGFAAALPKLLESKVYVGASAGSIILTHSSLGGSQALRQVAEGNEIDMSAFGPEGQRSSKTLNLVDIEFRPHYKAVKYPFITDDLLQQAADTSGRKLYALDDDSALKIVDDKIEIISEGDWKVFGPTNH